MLKVSYLYPEVHNCCENWSLPAPLIEQYSNQSSGCEESQTTRLGTKFREHTKFVGSIGLVLDAIINSVNCIC